MVADSCSISGSIDFRPVTIEITIGKNAISTATTILGARSVPSHTTNSGAIAIFGITWANNSNGYNVRSIVTEYTMITAVSTPTTMAITKPAIVSQAVTSVLSQKYSDFSAITPKVSPGEATR